MYYSVHCLPQHYLLCCTQLYLLEQHALSAYSMVEPCTCIQVVADYQRVAMWHGMGFVSIIANGTFTLPMLNLVYKVPLQYQCWMNLIYNQVTVPHASFTGHLCGILAGLVHVFLPKAGKNLDTCTSPRRLSVKLISMYERNITAALAVYL